MANTVKGTGATLRFGNSDFLMNLTNLAHSTTRESLDATHLETEDGMEFIPADLPDYGEITADVQFDPAGLVSGTGVDIISQAPETLTFVFSGDSAAKAVGTGFATAFDNVSTANEIMTGTLTLKISGQMVYTAS